MSVRVSILSGLAALARDLGGVMLLPPCVKRWDLLMRAPVMNIEYGYSFDCYGYDI